MRFSSWAETLSLNRWHWIVASRDGREGKLQVDGGIPVVGRSPPTLSELNLELPLFVAGVPDVNLLSRDLGILETFNGAIQYLSVNGETFVKEITLGFRERGLLRYEGPPCGSKLTNPCQNGGTCFPRLDLFVCLCPPQFSGKHCQNYIE